jgi:hypothetical protein
LTKSEQSIFSETAQAFPHLGRADIQLLASFAVATAMAQRLKKGNDVANWERAVRTQLAVGRSLRLTQQSRTKPETLYRRIADDPNKPRPWLPGADDTDTQKEGLDDS